MIFIVATVEFPILNRMMDLLTIVKCLVVFFTERTATKSFLFRVFLNFSLSSVCLLAWLFCSYFSLASQVIYFLCNKYILSLCILSLIKSSYVVRALRLSGLLDLHWDIVQIQLSSSALQLQMAYAAAFTTYHYAKRTLLYRNKIQKRSEQKSLKPFTF